MSRYIQGKDGKMKGSIGLGKDAVPTPQFVQRMLHNEEASESDSITVFDIWEENRRKQHEEELLSQEYQNPADFPSIPVSEVGVGDIVLIPSSDETNDAGVPARVTDKSSDTRDFVVRFRAETRDGIGRDVEMKYPHTVPLLSRNPDNGAWPPSYWAPERSEPQEVAQVFDEYEYEERRLALRTQTNSLPDEQEPASSLKVEDIILIPSSVDNDYQWIAAEVAGIRDEPPYTVIQTRDYFGNEQEFSLTPDNNIGVLRKGREHQQEGWPPPGTDKKTRLQALSLRRGDVIELDSTAPGGRQMVRIKGIDKFRDASAANKAIVWATDRNGHSRRIVFDMNHPLDVIERGPDPDPEPGPDPYRHMADAYPESKFPTPADALVDFWSFLSNFGKKDRR